VFSNTNVVPKQTKTTSASARTTYIRKEVTILMSEKGKEILTKLTEGMEKANDLQREFLFGYAEAIIATHKQNEEKEVEAETKQ
jgi:hypothetical protein